MVSRKARSARRGAERCGRQQRGFICTWKDLNDSTFENRRFAFWFGTNLQALIDDIAAGTLNAEIVQVVPRAPTRMELNAHRLRAFRCLS